MRIDPQYLTIGRLFHEQYVFEVPKYQRSYRWSESQLEDFIADIVKCYEARLAGANRHHFFGGIVSVSRIVPGTSRRHCDIVDGQQRLATFIILVSAILSAYTALKNEASHQGDIATAGLVDARIRRLKDKYLEYEDEVNRQVQRIDRLRMSLADRQYFIDKLAGLSPNATRDSHKRLNEAFESVTAKVNATVDLLVLLPDKLDALARFEQILDTDCTVIHIVTDTQAEAYRLFQVLNDRGVNLTEGDLLRARTLELLDSPAFTSQQASAESAWNEILVDNPDQTEDFLRWYYSSVKGVRPGKTSLFDDCLDAFFPQHKNATISATDANAILTAINTLKQEMAYCRKLCAGEWPYPNSQQVTQWHRDRLGLLIKELGHTNCMPLFLAACKLDEGKFAAIVQLVELFIFRYKLICNAHIGPVTKVYHVQSKIIRVNPQSYNVAGLRTELQSLQSTRVGDAVFSSQLSALQYQLRESNKYLKYFLMTLEHYYRWFQAGANGVPQCMDTTRVFDFSNTTIEHVYPQNATAPVLDTQIEPVKHNIGNLTFMGPGDNQAIGNSDFATKRPVLAASSVMLNREIAINATWDRTSILSRNAHLVGVAVRVFRA